MRITNAMQSNNILLNIQRNMSKLSKLQYQQATGNKIQYASDDPIIAGRSLRLRSSLSEVQQYQNNVAQGKSWMDESAFSIDAINEILFAQESTSIRSNLVLAASGQYGTDDKDKFITSIKELIKEISTQANNTYNGRYIFSGFRTDEPPLIQRDDPNKQFNITQHFTPDQIEKTTSYYKDPYTDGTVEPRELEKSDYYRIRIPYTEGVSNISMTDSGGNPVAITTVSISNPNAYTPGPGETYFIEETGELVMHQDVHDAMVLDGNAYSVNYDKIGFNQHEINPKVYFDCTDLTTGLSYSMQDANGDDYHIMEYEFGTNNKIQVNSLAKDFITADLINDLNEIVRLVDGFNLSNEDELRKYYASQGMTGEALDSAVADRLEQEESFYKSMLGDKMNELIGKLDEHAKDVSKEETTVGARMNRLELIGNRLGEEKVNYQKLIIENEAVDYDELSIELSTQLAIFSMSLQISSSLLQMSLGNYI